MIEPSIRTLIDRVMDEKYTPSRRSRFSLVETFAKRPRIYPFEYNADGINTQAEIRQMQQASNDWGVGGVNPVTPAFVAGGGVSVVTGTSANDLTCLTPTQPSASVDSDANGSAWTAAGWTPAARAFFDARIAAVTLPVLATDTGGFVAVGLRTGGITDTDPTNDADMAAFWFQPDYSAVAHGGKWFARIRKASADADVLLTGAPVPTNGREYHLEIRIQPDLRPFFFINGVRVGVGPALTSAAALLPFIAVKTGTTAARQVNARFVEMSRLYPAS